MIRLILATIIFWVIPGALALWAGSRLVRRFRRWLRRNELKEDRADAMLLLEERFSRDEIRDLMDAGSEVSRPRETVRPGYDPFNP